MLSIGKLPFENSAGYYLDAVAEGWEDYYTGAGEAAGRWIGTGPARFGLAGVVDADDVRELFAFRDPRTAESLRRSQYGRPPRRGFDFTFSAPKSVSLLHALGNDPTRAAVVAAHEVAVSDAVSFLEEEATYLRTGDGEITKASELTIAAFTQRTNREEEPQLHTQCLVLNRGRTTLADGSDSGWRSLHSPTLYRAAKLAGMVYQTRLRRELAGSHGVRFTPVSANGQADIAGVPRAAIEAFSTRRQQILESLKQQGLLDVTGSANIHARETVALQTRAAKRKGGSAAVVQACHADAMPADDRRQWWRHIADRAGLGDVNRWTDRSTAAIPAPPAKALVRQWVADIRRGPVSSKPSFTRHELMQRLLVDHDLAVSWRQLQSMADELVADDEVVMLPDAVVLPAGLSAATYTTRGLLELEERIVRRAVAGRNAGIGRVVDEVVEGVLEERPYLAAGNGEQAAALAYLTRSGNAVDLVVGVAGAGKTTMMAAYREAAERAGYRVLGAAYSGKAALGLQTEAGIESYTIASIRRSIESRTGMFDDRTIVIIDEAAAVATSDLAAVMQAAQQAATKVILIGDDYQLPAIGAGGVFRALLDRLDHPQLSNTRRQSDPVQVAALGNIRHGDLDRGLQTLHDNGQVAVSTDPAELYAEMARGWADSISHGHDTLMLAHRRIDVARLNDLGRAEATRRKWLGPVAGGSADGNVRVGDRVLLTRNQRRDRYYNGMRGIVTGRTDRGIVIALAEDNDRQLVVDGNYAAAHMSLGYAMTGHKAQGTTVDATHIYTGGTSREWLYSVLSRHRHTVKLYVSGGHRDPHHTSPPTALVGAKLDDGRVWTRFKRLARRSERQFTAIDATLCAAEAHPELTWVKRLGPIPDDPARRQQWRRALLAVRDYRAAAHIPAAASTTLLGGPPQDPTLTTTYRETEQLVSDLQPADPEHAPHAITR